MTEKQTLPEIRARIDSLDEQIQELIRQRAECALDVAKSKRAEAEQQGSVATDFYRPEREAEVLRMVQERNNGPLDDETVAHLFRELMSACLALQERRGIDVNFVLFAFWLSSRGVALDRTEANKIEEAIARFRTEVVRPLRAARRALRGMQRAPEPSGMAERWADSVERLRSRVAAAELDGEHLIQLALEEAGASLEGGNPRGASLAAANLRAIAPFDQADRADLAVLFMRAFEGISKPALARAFRDADLA